MFDIGLSSRYNAPIWSLQTQHSLPETVSSAFHPLGI